VVQSRDSGRWFELTVTWLLCLEAPSSVVHHLCLSFTFDIVKSFHYKSRSREKFKKSLKSLKLSQFISIVALSPRPYNSDNSTTILESLSDTKVFCLDSFDSQHLLRSLFTDLSRLGSEDRFSTYVWHNNRRARSPRNRLAQFTDSSATTGYPDKLNSDQGPKSSSLKLGPHPVVFYLQLFLTEPPSSFD
jgi:hypothetical protein